MAIHVTAHHHVRQPATHQPQAAATLMSRTSLEPATPPASRSWFAISPGFHADDPGTVAFGISGRPPLNIQVDDGFHAWIRWNTQGS